jgi:hypothetical protein
MRDPHRFNYDPTKGCFAYFGFYPGAAPDKEKSRFPHYQDHVKQSNPKLLDQVSDLTQGAKLDRENDLEIPRLRSE